MDVFTPSKRSEVMQAIRSSGNRSTEMRLLAMFRRHQLSGWRRGVLLTGRPDFVFQRERVAVFVDGCFWHGCSNHGRAPTTNQEFWVTKLARNRERDREVSRALRREGWAVVRIWEHDLGRENELRIIQRLRLVLERPCPRTASGPLER